MQGGTSDAADLDGAGAAAAETGSLARRAATGVGWITLEMLCVQGVSLLVFAVMARFLNPRAFGLATISFVLVHSCKNILFEGIATVVARKSHATDVEYSTAFWITVSIACVAFVGLQGFSLAADGAFDAPGIGSVLRAMSVMLLVQGVARTQEVWMMRHFRYRSLAVRAIAGAVAGGALGAAAAAGGFGVWALVIQQVVASLGGFALLWFTCPWRPAWVFSPPTAREIVPFAWSMSGSSLAYAFNQSCDTLLIGLLFGPSSVGVYSVGKRLRLALQLVAATPLNGVAMPALAEVQHDPARFTQVLLTATAVVFAVCAPVFLGAAAVGSDAIALVFGPQWGQAAPIFSMLAVGGLLAIVTDYNSNVFIIRNRPVWTLYMALLNVAATLALFFALRTSRPDLIALPFVLPQLLAVPVSLYLLRRVTGISLWRWAGAVLPALVAAAAMVAAVLLAAPLLQSAAPVWRLAALVCGGAAVYAAAFALLSPRLVRDIIRMVARRG